MKKTKGTLNRRKCRLRASAKLIMPTAAILAMSPPLSHSAPTPEKEAIELAKILKPVGDDEWAMVAGGKAQEKYAVIYGDTLYDISNRLFGDPKYWPKIWALNNDKIMNPHLIYPGKMIAFVSGTGTSLPTVDVAPAGPESPKTVATASDAPSASPKLIETRSDAVAPEWERDSETKRLRKGRSTDWKRLPRQRWEGFKIEMPAGVDPTGFDRRNKIRFKTVHGFDLDAIASTEKIQMLGTIVGSQSFSNTLSFFDVVYIQSDQTLQVGQIYAVTDEPADLRSVNGRRGYSYAIRGKVKITGIKDKLFVGLMVNNRGYLFRGAKLIPLPARGDDLTVIPGPSPIRGSVTIDRQFASSAVAQHKLVFVDRGSDDGIQPGMVFRAFQHDDPGTLEKIADGDIFAEADMVVVQVSPKFSVAIVKSSSHPIVDDTACVLVTDVSDLNRGRELLEKAQIGGSSNRDELDELDLLDAGGLGKDEERELQQLERWKKNPEAAPSPQPSPETAPLPSPLPAPEAAPPPPPPPPAPPIDTPPEPPANLPAPEELMAPPPEGAPASVPAPETMPETAPPPETAPMPEELPPPAP